jgi:hypothetical protein
MLRFSLDTGHLVVVSNLACAANIHNNGQRPQELITVIWESRPFRHPIVGLGSLTRLLACMTLIFMQRCSHHARSMQLIRIWYAP